ncbi:hypothetical protein HXX76_008427 [Chlamydomonas incerta]|uniref:Protein kinase domain-containing protein n=1 Tax=Chlamydomonas incerta TaxID=51695 RepID=A0A835SX44_CHLIN|nr:hypothetical protein HXX76_008427 [Chlamydomonas incerta]|eukprot:KAG2433366.1 hypothetical protein HXX76_008427 [Chlamydomonas incerta]
MRFDGFKLPVELGRNVTITGADPDPNRWPLLLLYATKKIQLADRVALTLRNLIARPAATEFFLRSPSLGILEASQPGSRSFVITRDAALFLPYGFPVELGLTYLVTLERPPELPGEQAGDHFFNQTGLPPINDTSVPIMSRYRPGLGFFQDFALVSVATDEATGSVLPLNYYLWFLNTYYFQEKDLSAECLAVNDPVTCYLIDIKGVNPNTLGGGNSSTVNATSATYSGGSDGGSAASGGSGAGDDAVSTGTIVGAVVGSVLGAALLAAAAAAAVLMYRRRRPHPSTPGASEDASAAQAKSGGDASAAAGANCCGGSNGNGSLDTGGSQSSTPAAAGDCEAAMSAIAAHSKLQAAGSAAGGGQPDTAGAGAGGSAQQQGAVGVGDVTISVKSGAVLAACLGDGEAAGSTAPGSDGMCASTGGIGDCIGGAPGAAVPSTAGADAPGLHLQRLHSQQHAARALLQQPASTRPLTRAATNVSSLGETVIAAYTPFNRHLNLAVDLDESSVCASSDQTGSQPGLLRTVPGGSSSTGAAAAAASLGLAQSSLDASGSGPGGPRRVPRPQAPSPPLNLSPALAVALNDCLAAAAAGGDGAGSSTEKAGADVVQLLPIVLGKGSFGRVLEGRYRGQRVAVKQLHHELVGQLLSPSQAAAHADDLYESFMQEVDVLGRCDHPNIARLYAACLTPPKLALVMELADTSLDKLLFREYAGSLMPLGKVLHIATQIAQGLCYLHPTIVHRDLKPANVLINNPSSDTPVVKLTDFGLARMRTATKSTCTPEAGTAAFTAPECFDVENSIVTHRADIYSFGVVLWTMLTGLEPWPGRNIVTIAFTLVMRKERLPIGNLSQDRCPLKLRRLLLQCWDADPLRRPAAADLVKELTLISEQEAKRPQMGPSRAAGALP